MISNLGNIKSIELKENGGYKILELRVSVRKWSKKDGTHRQLWTVSTFKNPEALFKTLKEGQVIHFTGEETINASLYKGEPRAWLNCKAHAIEFAYEWTDDQNESPATKPNRSSSSEAWGDSASFDF
tara:strand:+ start:207 stop:587 length:381 start_codon:yes stop_codon:yes gene_type:complete